MTYIPLRGAERSYAARLRDSVFCSHSRALSNISALSDKQFVVCVRLFGSLSVYRDSLKAVALGSLRISAYDCVNSYCVFFSVFFVRCASSVSTFSGYTCITGIVKSVFIGGVFQWIGSRHNMVCPNRLVARPMFKLTILLVLQCYTE